MAINLLPRLIILAPSDLEQRKTFVFRNNTIYDVAVKIHCTNVDVLRANQLSGLIKAGKTSLVDIGFLANHIEKDNEELRIYMRSVSLKNEAEIAQWVESRGNEKHQTAFRLRLVVSNSMFSAGRVILDVPGMASLGEYYSGAKLPIYDTKTCREFDPSPYHLPSGSSGIRVRSLRQNVVVEQVDIDNRNMSFFPCLSSFSSSN